MTKTQTEQNIKTWETSLKDILEKTEEKCEKCFILTPLRCATKCDVWKTKNEFRGLYEKMRAPGYPVKLLNTLKNKRRLQVLEIISDKEASISQIQQKLKKLGYYHSQQTITHEYIDPLIKVGLVREDRNRYHTTLFGCKLRELTSEFHEICDLPSHSECYEELTLSVLLNGPKTYEDLKQLIPTKSVTRVLSRLKKAELVNVPKEREYMFYFKTRRDPRKESFSPTERRVYENIPTEGIPAGKLSKKVGVSLRRTYKYLRRLRKKKLVFTRKRPKSYALTDKGLRMAVMLDGIYSLVMEALVTATSMVKDEKIQRLISDTPRRGRKKRRERKSLTPLTVIPHVRQS